MKSSTGPWVSGDDFFDREAELDRLGTRVREGNHILLSGQRRMGKTSIVQELGRRLEADGWIFLFIDIEGAKCGEDVIAGIAGVAHPIRPIASRFAQNVKGWVSENVEEIGALDFSVKIRGGLNDGNWQRHGEQLLHDCAAQDKRVLLVIDEVPIFLKRMRHRDGNTNRVEEFLSWLRGVVQSLGDKSPVLILSGSIGLEPLVRRLGLSDRINHLFPIRLGPWNRETSIECFNCLATSHGLRVENGVSGAVYDALGIGIPHHIQSFFARLRDFAKMQGRDRITVLDVGEVYQTELLGPSGQSDLVHYETRLKEALDEESHSIAMEILAETATRNVFTQDARRSLETGYSKLIDSASERVADALEVLVHDGYIEAVGDTYRFPSRLLKDWWFTRFRGHHLSLEERFTNVDSERRDQ